MGFKEGAGARGRKVGVLDLVAHIHVVRPERRKIPGDANIDGVLFPGGWFKQMNRAELLVNDCVRASRS